MTRNTHPHRDLELKCFAFHGTGHVSFVFSESCFTHNLLTGTIINTLFHPSESSHVDTASLRPLTCSHGWGGTTSGGVGKLAQTWSLSQWYCPCQPGNCKWVVIWAWPRATCPPQFILYINDRCVSLKLLYYPHFCDVKWLWDKLISLNLIYFLTSLLFHVLIIPLTHHPSFPFPSVGSTVLRMSFSTCKTLKSPSLKSPAQACHSLWSLTASQSSELRGDFMTVPCVHYYNAVCTLHDTGNS